MQRSLLAVRGDLRSEDNSASIMAASDAVGSASSITSDVPAIVPADEELPWGAELQALGFTRISSPRLDSDAWDIRFDPETGQHQIQLLQAFGSFSLTCRQSWPQPDTLDFQVRHRWLLK